MAMWRATYRRPNSLDNYLYFNSADARSASPKALKEATTKAAAKAQERLVAKGISDAKVVAVNCVG